MYVDSVYAKTFKEVAKLVSPMTTVPLSGCLSFQYQRSEERGNMFSVFTRDCMGQYQELWRAGAHRVIGLGRWVNGCLFRWTWRHHTLCRSIWMCQVWLNNCFDHFSEVLITMLCSIPLLPYAHLAARRRSGLRGRSPEESGSQQMSPFKHHGL